MTSIINKLSYDVTSVSIVLAFSYFLHLTLTFVLVIFPAGCDSCKKTFNFSLKLQVHCTNSTVEALQNATKKVSTSNDKH